MYNEEMYLHILENLEGDKDDIYELKNIIKHHFKMIRFMKDFSLYDIFRYENSMDFPNMMKESITMMLDQNAGLKAEVNTLRKKLGKIEKYD